MAKKSYVLEALRVLVPEEILKIADFLRLRHRPFKKTSLESEDRSLSKTDKADKDNIFTLPQALEKEEKIEEEDKEDSFAPENIDLSETELFLENLHQKKMIMKEEIKEAHKVVALKEYRKNLNTLTRKKRTEDGREVVEKVKTIGVLIDKKQA